MDKAAEAGARAAQSRGGSGTGVQETYFLAVAHSFTAFRPLLGCIFSILILANGSKAFDEGQNVEIGTTMGNFHVRCSSVRCYVLNLLASMLRI